MDRFQEERQFIDSLQNRWDSVTSEYQHSKTEHEQAERINSEVNQDKHQTKLEVISCLKTIKEKLENKIESLNDLYNHFQAELVRLRKAQSFIPAVGKMYSQDQLDNLCFVVSKPLSFDSVSAKQQGICREYQMRCNSLKEDIKTIKLKLSLSELQYKQFVNSRKVSQREG